MCGRYTLTMPADVVAAVFGLDKVIDYPPRWNIAPTQMAPVIRTSHTTGQRIMQMMRWGLIPHWSKDESSGGGAKMINARSETVARKAPFRQLLERRRCLVPADAFYEWSKPAAGERGARKQPFAIRLRDDRVFAFAGLWDRWRDQKGETNDSYTILTTTPNEVAGRYHDRMPVMLIEPAQWDRWLDESITDAEALKGLLAGGTPEDDAMRAYPVSARVNSAVLPGGELNDDPGLLAELPVSGSSPPRQRGLFE